MDPKCYKSGNLREWVSDAVETTLSLAKEGVMNWRNDVELFTQHTKAGCM